jgi:o-succinylbenzoate synthase
MINARFFKYQLEFKAPAGTSRGVLTFKDTYFLILEHEGRIGIGECALFKGLSYDDNPNYEDKIKWLVDNINQPLAILQENLRHYPSILFGLESAFESLSPNGDMNTIFQNDFSEANGKIPINGLIWMGDEQFMLNQINQKIEEGFTCLKMKIGAIDFERELATLRYIREYFPSNELEIRVDANGAFTKKDVYKKLEKLAKFDIHSIEQPIAPGQADLMKKIANESIIDIALDEELIGIVDKRRKEDLIDKINPHFIILKPSLHGGFSGSEEWVEIVNQLNVGWWITSALESNVGLNAIAQFTYDFETNMYQGLGTGSLFTNNIQSPLVIDKGFLKIDKSLNWDFSNLNI